MEAVSCKQTIQFVIVKMMEDNEMLPNRRTKKFCTLSCDMRPFSTSLSNNLREFIQKASVALSDKQLRLKPVSSPYRLRVYDQYVTLFTLMVSYIGLIQQCFSHGIFLIVRFATLMFMSIHCKIKHMLVIVICYSLLFLQMFFCSFSCDLMKRNLLRKCQKCQIH